MLNTGSEKPVITLKVLLYFVVYLVQLIGRLSHPRGLQFSEQVHSGVTRGRKGAGPPQVTLSRRVY